MLVDVDGEVGLDLLKVLAEPMRWRIVQLLATGGSRSLASSRPGDEPLGAAAPRSLVGTRRAT